MNKIISEVIAPIINNIRPESILISADTEEIDSLIDCCNENRTLFKIVNPIPTFQEMKLDEKYSNVLLEKKRFNSYIKKNTTSNIIILDMADLSQVYNKLKEIETYYKEEFPIIFIINSSEDYMELSKINMQSMNPITDFINESKLNLYYQNFYFYSSTMIIYKKDSKLYSLIKESVEDNPIFDLPYVHNIVRNEEEINSLNDEINHLSERNKILSIQNLELYNENKEIMKNENYIHDLETFKKQVIASRSWKLTSYLRKIGSLTKKVLRKLKIKK